MLKLTNIKLAFDHQPEQLWDAASKVLGISRKELVSLRVGRRSLDARKGRPLLRVYTLLVEVRSEDRLQELIKSNRDISRAKDWKYEIPQVSTGRKNGHPLVVGAGPAGIFAGLILAEAGLEPIILERGEPVKQRSADTTRFWRDGILDQESNAQFGEGGAGAFSDGKLQTRVKDRQNRDKKVLQEFVSAGGPEEILYENKPHIGTANLIRIVKNLREKIENLGGEYRFRARVDDLQIEDGWVKGVVLANGEKIPTSAVILAVGHSARDTYSMLNDRGVSLKPKAFSVGFRIEHPQIVIDQAQYGVHAGHPSLGAADYQLAFHSKSGRTVYSFCMCPGGEVIAASSEPGCLVTNGMSQYARDKVNANSAIVAEVYPADIGGDPLGGIEFQRLWEGKAYRDGGSNYHAPIQLLGDFLEGRATTSLGRVQPTYTPGFRPGSLEKSLPPYVIEVLKLAFPEFNRRIEGFSMPDAVLTGVETRTSAPVRIIRDESYQSVSVRGLYPCGEGSGYAGGIMSSAMDGIKAAEAVCRALADSKS